MVLPQEPAILGHEQVLTAYATMRGYMATGGRPDQSRAGRIILKDYVSVRKDALKKIIVFLVATSGATWGGGLLGS